MRPNQMRYHPSAKKIWGPPLEWQWKHFEYKSEEVQVWEWLWCSFIAIFKYSVLIDILLNINASYDNNDDDDYDDDVEGVHDDDVNGMIIIMIVYVVTF